jgi:hypothetical protein
VHEESRAWRAAPVLAAGAIAIAYLVVQPRTVDLAAAVYRARLFEDAGFTLWDNGWYAGHPTLSYSVLFPPLAALLGPALLGALATVASAALFGPLARRHFGARAARCGAVWFGAGAAATLLSGRIAFAAGAAFGLAAVLALQRGRGAVACVFALLCGLTSPVAGLFLALAGAAYALGARRRAGALVALAALAPPAALALLFPDGSAGPFAFSAFWPLPLLALGFAALVPAGERALRTGAALYALLATAAYVFDTPLGGAAVRLGALAGAALVLCVAAAHPPRGTGRRTAFALLFAGFAFIQWSPAVRDLAAAQGDRFTEPAAYRSLLRFLDRADGPPFRVEIPFTAGHWEAAEVAPHHPLGRGWLRPADIEHNRLFYEGALTHDRYRRWLSEHGVRFVAVARGAEPDYSARDELKLIASRPPYLRPVYGSRDWDVYEVTVLHAMVVPDDALALIRLGADSVTLRAKRPGTAVVRVRWTRFWSARGGCVERAGEWTRVTAEQSGTVRLTVALTGDRCG